MTHLLGAMALSGAAAAPLAAQVRIHIAPAPLPAPPADLEPAAEPDDTVAPATGRTVDELVTALDAPSLTVRQGALNELSNRSDLTLPELEAALDRPDLSPEQRVRLEAAALDRFMDTPRGAMGITWNLEFETRASIMGTVDGRGFDAEHKLLPGDMFVAIDNVSIQGVDFPQRLLRWHIISRDPGEILPVTVRRAGEKIQIDLRLGSYDQLGEGRGVPSPGDFAAAFRLRQERRGRVNPSGDSLGLAADEWIVARVEGAQRSGQRAKERRAAGQGIPVAGGVPRQGADDVAWFRPRVVANARLIPGRNFNQWGGRALDPIAQQPMRAMSTQDEIRTVEQKVIDLREQLKNAGDESRRPGLGVAQLQNFEQQRAAAERRLAAAVRVLEALKAEAAENGELAEQPEK